jgi:hypothetical protein
MTETDEIRQLGDGRLVLEVDRDMAVRRHLASIRAMPRPGNFTAFEMARRAEEATSPSFCAAVTGGADAVRSPHVGPMLVSEDAIRAGLARILGGRWRGCVAGTQGDVWGSADTGRAE